MDANGEEDGQFDRLAFFESRRQRQSIHGAMNPQRKHHRGGEFRQPVRRGLVEMAGRARRADVINIFGDDRKKEIARSRHRQKPPVQVFPAFRRDAAKRDAQQGSGAEADEGAKLSVRPGQKPLNAPPAIAMANATKIWVKMGAQSFFQLQIICNIANGVETARLIVRIVGKSWLFSSVALVFLAAAAGAEHGSRFICRAETILTPAGTRHSRSFFLPF